MVMLKLGNSKSSPNRAGNPVDLPTDRGRILGRLAKLVLFVSQRPEDTATQIS